MTKWPEALEVWECSRELRVYQPCEVKGDQELWGEVRCCLCVCAPGGGVGKKGRSLSSELVDLIGQKNVSFG